MTRPHLLETPLMRSPDTEYLCCRFCFYYERGFCHRRERRARWDPNSFVCGDFGITDEEPTERTDLIGWGVWIE